MDKHSLDALLVSLKIPVCKNLGRLNGHISTLVEDAYNEACLHAIKRGPASFQTKAKLQAYLSTCAHGYLTAWARRDARRGSVDLALEEWYSPQDGLNLEMDYDGACQQCGIPKEEWPIIREILEGRLSIVDAAMELNVEYHHLHRKVGRVGGWLRK